MKNKFSQRLMQLRKKSGMSQKTAAQKLGISQALLSHYEKGIRECGLDFVIKAAKVFNVSSDYLLGLVDRLPTDSADNAIYDELSKKPKLYLARNKLQNTTDLLYSITAHFGNPKMYQDINNLLYSNIYLAMQMFSRSAAGKAADEDKLFSVPFQVASFKAVALQAYSYEKVMQKLSETENRFILDSESLQNEFPSNAAAAISVIESVENVKSRQTVEKM